MIKPYHLCLLLSLTACSLKKQVVISDLEWQKATTDVETKYANEVQDRLSPYFVAAKLSYPPKKIALLTFKENKQMELAKNLKKEVDTGAHGTQSYVIKKGINKNKIASKDINGS